MYLPVSQYFLTPETPSKPHTTKAHETSTEQNNLDDELHGTTTIYPSRITKGVASSATTTISPNSSKNNDIDIN